MSETLNVPYFAVGTEVWTCLITSGLEPARVEVETVAIWMNDRGCTISYTFLPIRNRGLFGRTDSEIVFATQAEAEQFRAMRISQMQRK
jgi:hypothetical protein